MRTLGIPLRTTDAPATSTSRNRWLDALLSTMTRDQTTERPRHPLLDGLASASRAAAVAFLGA